MTTLLEALRSLRAWHPTQLALRIIVLAGPFMALLAASVAGNGPAVWVVALVLILSVLWAAAPDSGAGTVAMLLVVFWWTRVPDDALHPAALVAALALVAAHLAALVSSTAPPRTPVDPAVARLWVLRAVAVLAPAPILWFLARGLRGQEAPGDLWPAALAAAVVAVVVLGAGLGRREERG